MATGTAAEPLQVLREAIEGLDLAVHGDAIAEARELIDRLQARVTQAEAQFVQQGLAERDGYPNAAAYFRHRAKVTVAESRRLAARARRVAAWPQLGDAWRSGAVTGAQVDLACTRVPDRHVERFAATIDDTLGIIRPLTAHHTGIVLTRWASHADDAAQREAADAGIEPAALVPARELSASRTSDDELVMNGHLDKDSGAIVERSLIAATRDDLEGETRTPTQRRADALVEIARHYLDTIANPGTDRRRERLTLNADLIVVYRAWLRALGVKTAADLHAFFAARPNLGEVDRGLFMEAFDGNGGVATTLDGHAVTDALVAATASGGVLELLLTANNRILNFGRSRRTFTDAQRRALLTLWGGCACCGAPPEQCEIHHIRPWDDGGLTDIANGVPKCKRCHLEHHRLRWRDRTEPDGTYVIALPDGTERRHRPGNHDTQLPMLPVATTATPLRVPRYDPDHEQRWTPWDEPDVDALGHDLVMSRFTNGDGHPTTEALRDQLERRLAELEPAA